MKRIPVKLISEGHAEGRAVLYTVRPSPVQTETTQDTDKECVRFERALSAARQELQAISSRVRGEFGQDEAEIFDSHLLILDDPVVVDDVQRRIEKHQLTAEAAVQQSINEFAGRLEGVDDPYLRERSQDIRDIGNRLLRQIEGHSSERFAGLPRNAIIVAEELMPSDLIEVDHTRLAGIVTSRGGVTSHVGILSRSLGIPAATGVDDVTRVIPNDARLLIDGEDSEIVVNPTAARTRAHRAKQRRLEEQYRDARAQQSLPSVTKDGASIQLMANLARPNEAEFTAMEELEGVGLLRTEFLFLDHLEPPSFELQQSLYENVARRLQGRELVIRTLDLGGDKFPLFLDRGPEINPGMGVRGVRYSMTQALDLFREQVAAVLAVARNHPVSLLLPMVVDLDDLFQARDIIAEVARGMDIHELPPTGVLVETPSAVFLIEDIARHVDFVSVGTNDLSQFVLAADRNALESVQSTPAIHPAVLRAVKRVAETCAREQKPLTVCGEAAGVPSLAGLLIGVGVRRLSMSPRTSAGVRHFIRNNTVEHLESVANLVLGASGMAESAAHVRTLET